MSEKHFDIKEVALKNNCPVCFGKEGLRLTFQQKIIETKFYKSITSEINHELVCEKCQSIIYPIQWTDDVERVIDYQKKAIITKKPSTYFKNLSWILIIINLIIIAVIVLTIFYVKL